MREILLLLRDTIIEKYYRYNDIPIPNFFQNVRRYLVPPFRFGKGKFVKLLSPKVKWGIGFLFGAFFLNFMFLTPDGIKWKDRLYNRFPEVSFKINPIANGYKIGTIELGIKG